MEEFKLTVLPDTDPILRLKSVEVTSFDDELKNLVKAMIFTMTVERGAGLAAPQVGKSIRLFVTKSDIEVQVYINPVIMIKSKEKDTEIEGCLSLRGRPYRVKRAKQLIVKYQDINGKIKSKTLEGWDARVFLHEYDHLMGVLISDIGEKI